jgi:hypothetical protein
MLWGLNGSVFAQITLVPTLTYAVALGVIVKSRVKVMVYVGTGVGVGVGVAVTFAVFTTTTTASFVGTGVGGTVVTTVVGTGVGTGVATGAAGWDVHPASRIPMNRIARTTKIFFMHHFLLFRYLMIFNYFVGGIAHVNYLMGTTLFCSMIAEGVVKIARKEGEKAIGHGCTISELREIDTNVIRTLP